jgi:uncharacterized membrane protein
MSRRRQAAGGNRIGAQEAADRIRILREELATEQVQAVLALTPDQRARLDDWSRTALAALAQQFDVDTTVSQKRVSWGMRIASTLGGLATCAAVVLFGAAAYTARMGYHWLEFYDRPEHFLVLGLFVFTLPYIIKHTRNVDFPPAYRLTGALTVFIAILSLAERGVPSYLPWDQVTIERLHEFAGLISSAGAIWLGVARGWGGIVNTAAAFFTLFLFTRLYHWWWDWMPKYLFFAAIGTLGIALVLAFKHLRGKMIHREIEALA